MTKGEQYQRRLANILPGDWQMSWLWFLRLCGATAQEKGWTDLTPELFQAWAHRELGEAFEHLLKGKLTTEVWFREEDGKPEGFLAELADVFILLGHMIWAIGPSLFLKVLYLKLQYNRERPQRNGRPWGANELGKPLGEWEAIRKAHGA